MKPFALGVLSCALLLGGCSVIDWVNKAPSVRYVNRQSTAVADQAQAHLGVIVVRPSRPEAVAPPGLARGMSQWPAGRHYRNQQTLTAVYMATDESNRGVWLDQSADFFDGAWTFYPPQIAGYRLEMLFWGFLVALPPSQTGTTDLDQIILVPGCTSGQKVWTKRNALTLNREHFDSDDVATFDASGLKGFCLDRARWGSRSHG